jgi:TonB family protein
VKELKNQIAMKNILVFCFVIFGFTSVYSQQNTDFPVGPDVQPKFSGDVNKYLSNHIIYPADAKINNIQGTVFVSFIVEVDGSLSDVKILRGLHNSLDTEAMRVVFQMPKWSPATKNGQAERCSYMLPVRFTLPKKTIAQ